MAITKEERSTVAHSFRVPVVQQGLVEESWHLEAARKQERREELGQGHALRARPSAWSPAQTPHPRSTGSMNSTLD